MTTAPDREEMMKGQGETTEETGTEDREVSVDQACEMLRRGDGQVCLIDIRGRGEMALGYIKGAALIPAGELKTSAGHIIPDKDKPVILYCASGHRSLSTAADLRKMGYTKVMSMAGGMQAWMDAGYEVENETLFTREQLVHYSRQMLLSEVGVDGQTLLLKGKVLVVGAGGLGSPAVLYLAASGVGTIGIVDFDQVDASNLNRQVIHSYASVGQPKTDSAKEGIARINPDVQVPTFNERLTPANALDIVRQFDVVLDGSDNFQTKYLLNDAAFLAGKPYVFGAAVRMEGQASVFFPKGGGPCLRCMMPQPPSQEFAPT